MLGSDDHFSRGPLASWNGFWGCGLAGQPCAPESALHETRYVRRLQNGIFECEVKALPAGKLFPRPLFPRTACPAERVPEVATLPTSRRGRWQRESAPGGLDGKVDSPEAVGLAPAPGASPAGRQGRDPGSRNSGSGSASSARSKVATHAKARNAILGLHCASKRRVPPAKMGKLYRAEMSLGPTSWRSVLRALNSNCCFAII